MTDNIIQMHLQPQVVAKRIRQALKDPNKVGHVGKWEDINPDLVPLDVIISCLCYAKVESQPEQESDGLFCNVLCVSRSSMEVRISILIRNKGGADFIDVLHVELISEE